MKVLLLGDTHGFGHVADSHIEYAKTIEDLGAIIQLGDFAFNFHQSFLDRWADAPCPVYFLRGNHDNTAWLRNHNQGSLTWMGSIEVAENLYWMPDGSVHLFGETVVGVLGGAVSIDRKSRIEGESWWSDETVTPMVADKLATEGGHIDVLLSHDAPGTPDAIGELIAGYKDDIASTANRDLLAAVVDVVKPKAVFHGHYHYRYTEEHMGAQVTGLADEGEDARIIVEW